MKNIGDKYVKRMTLRMSDRQLSHCVERANHLDISPSDYIRSLINKDIANYYYREARQNENVKRDWNENLYNLKVFYYSLMSLQTFSAQNFERNYYNY